MARISQLDLVQLNKELEKLDAFHSRISQLEKHNASLQQRLDKVETHAAPTSNNLVFSWTGSTGTISWVDGSVKDKDGNNVPVRSGALVGKSPSIYHWVAWNRVHQQMVAETDVNKLLSNKNNVVICQIFTGTSGQSGVAGGGGTNSTTELSGAKYKQF